MKMGFGILTAAGLALAGCGSTSTPDSNEASVAQSDTALRAAVGAFLTACVRATQPKNIEASLKSLSFVQTGDSNGISTFSAPFASATLAKNGLCAVKPISGTSSDQVTRLVNATLPNVSAGAQKQNNETWLLGSGAVVLISPADGTMTRTAVGAPRG